METNYYRFIMIKSSNFSKIKFKLKQIFNIKHKRTKLKLNKTRIRTVVELK